MTPSRSNGLANMLETMKRRSRMLIKDVPQFPSLIIRADELQPLGAFAEAQAEYLKPQPLEVGQAALILFKNLSN